MMHKKIAFLSSLSFFAFAFILSGCRDYGPSSIFGPRVEMASYRAVSVQTGDTVYRIAKRYDIAIRDLIEVNNLRPPYIIKKGQGLRLPKKRVHIVRKFETISSIARDRHVNQHDLIRNNSLKPPYTLYENQRLKLPYPKRRQPYWAQKRKKTIQRKITPSPAPLLSKPAIKKTGQKKVLSRSKNWKDNFIAPETGDKTALKSAPPTKPKAKRKEAVAAVTAGGKKVKTHAFQAPPKPTFKPTITAEKHPKKTPVKRKQSKASSNSKPSFSWPVRGRILSKYGTTKGGLKNDGVNIQAKRGTAVKAAESGQVVYVGGALKGYGNLILLKHNQGWLTTYAHLKNTRIKKGQKIRKGQIMGTVGTTGNVKTPQLHFEIRKRTQTLDPLRFLK